MNNVTPRQKTLVDHQVQIVNGRTRLIESLEFDYCPIYVCQACLRMGGAHRVSYRDLGQILCTHCCRLLRAIEKDQQQLDEIGRLIRKLQRTKHVH